MIMSLLVINLHTDEHPIYKATCINGYGSGYGNSIQEALIDAERQIGNLLSICNKVNIPLELKTKEQFMLETNPYSYGGLSDWNSSSVKWIEIDPEQLLRDFQNGEIR